MASILAFVVARVAELERSLIIERVRSGMARAKAQGKQIGRKPMDIDPVAFMEDRGRLSLNGMAEKYGTTRTSILRLQRRFKLDGLGTKGVRESKPEKPYFQYGISRLG